jgi:hypothetical protein
VASQSVVTVLLYLQCYTSMTGNLKPNIYRLTCQMNFSLTSNGASPWCLLTIRKLHMSPPIALIRGVTSTSVSFSLTNPWYPLSKLARSKRGTVTENPTLKQWGGGKKGGGELTYIWKVRNTVTNDTSEELRIIQFTWVTKCCSARQMMIKWVQFLD